MKATGNFEACQHVDPLLALNAQTRATIDLWRAKFPPERSRSALIQGLIAAQHQHGGWLSDELMAAVAKYLGVPPVWAYEVATFYSMIETAICTNISCWLNGAEDIVRYCEGKLGITLGESTADGRVYLKREEECLAACCGAPMMVVNGHYHENLDTDKVDRILESLK